MIKTILVLGLFVSLTAIIPPRSLEQKKPDGLSEKLPITEEFMAASQELQRLFDETKAMIELNEFYGKTNEIDVVWRIWRTSLFPHSTKKLRLHTVLRTAQTIAEKANKNGLTLDENIISQKNIWDRNFKKLEFPLNIIKKILTECKNDPEVIGQRLVEFNGRYGAIIDEIQKHYRKSE